MSPTRARALIARSGDERTNHEATAPPMTFKRIFQKQLCFVLLCFSFFQARRVENAPRVTIYVRIPTSISGITVREEVLTTAVIGNVSTTDTIVTTLLDAILGDAYVIVIVLTFATSGVKLCLVHTTAG